MSELTEIAEDVAAEILHHIDIMYPHMWTPVANSARTSIRNTIVNQVQMRIAALESPWISVDTLPEMPGQYLVNRKHSIGFDISFFDGVEFNIPGIVTHWFPLPPPPEKEK